ncbi:MAG: tetratricopeptide repeat protein [Gemmatimonadota bacterium]
MSDVEQALGQALELGEEGRWPEMAQLLGAALRDTPDDPFILCWLGVAERELGRDGVAYEHFKRAWQQDPLDPHILAICGAGLAAFDDAEAEAVLRAAALTGPDVPIARLHYGAYLARTGMFEPALEHLNAALELDPDDPAAHGELGIAYALKGDYARAADAMEAALERAADDSWTRVLLGLVNLQQGQIEAAAEQLIQAADERADDAEAQVLAALAAAAAGWDAAAENTIARAEFASEGADRELIEEAREQIEDGRAAAREFLENELAPHALRDRMMQPL